MMNYEDFKNYIKEHILGELPDKYREFEVSINKTIKNNGLELDGLCIRGRDNIAPVIYLNGYFEKYNQGASIEKVLKEIGSSYTNNMEHRNIPSDVSNMVTDIERAKEHIFSKVINTKTNEKLISNSPHTEFEDLSITYYIMVSKDKQGIASIHITDEIAAKLGVNEKELEQIARTNMHKNNPMYFVSMNEMLRGLIMPDILGQGMSQEETERMMDEMFPTREEIPMYVLSNETKVNGAIWMTNPEALNEISEKMGGDYYILPSSIHEVIIVPKVGMDASELMDMVKTVNRNEVNPADVLSDNVYGYDSKEHKLSIVADMKEHKHDINVELVKKNEKKQSVKSY